MALKSGLAAQLGVADEVTPGTPVAPSVFSPLINESLSAEIEPMESAAIIAGRRVVTSTQWAQGSIKVGGNVGLELTNKSMRTWFKHALGGESGSGPYTYTPGDLSGLSFTCQVGRPDVGTGTVRPFTYSGCKVKSWEIAAKAGELVTFGADLFAMHQIMHRTVADGVTTISSPSITSATAAFSSDDIGKPISGTGIPAATTIASVQSATAATLSQNATANGTGITFTFGLALGSASYAANLVPLSFAQATVTLAGSAFPCMEVSIKGDNSLKEDRGFLGQRWMSEGLEINRREYTGVLNAEYVDNTALRRFITGTEAALVVDFKDTTNTSMVQITTNVRFDGKNPNVSDADILVQELPFKCTASGADSTAITIVVANA